MAKQRPQAPGPAADWETPGARLLWLLHTRFGGNRSALARALRVSHSAIAKVVAGQAPGRKLLAAATEHLAVDADWLLTGRGQPFASPPGGLPVALAPLPGHPLLHQELAAGWVPTGDRAPRPSQYWLRLAADQPILRDPSRGFHARDELLMEADPGRFPEEAVLDGRLCVARMAGPPPSLKLGAMTYYPADLEGGERLLIDTFEREPAPGAVLREHAFREAPDGRFTYTERKLEVVNWRGTRRVVPLDEVELSIRTRPAPLSYEDIVAVWVGTLFRPEAGA